MPYSTSGVRTFWIVFSAVICGVVATARGDSEKPRSNVFMICVDDLRNCLELDGDLIAKTPNLDRLAAESRFFRRHYVQVAACGPSRCSMLTGRRIIQTWDVWNEDRKLRQEPRTPVSIAHHFRRHGYATVGIGKVSHEPGGTMPPEYEVHQIPYSWDKAFAPVGRWASPWHAFFAYSNGRAYNAVIRWVKDESPRLPFERGEVDDDGYADWWTYFPRSRIFAVSHYRQDLQGRRCGPCSMTPLLSARPTRM